MIVPFPGTQQAAPADVGGKAASLIRMTEAGLPVPPGAVLTTAFFAPWFGEVEAAATWSELIESTPDDWAPLCIELKKHALSLPFTATQRDALDALLRDVAEPSGDERFAVRSSSPDEDLASASFAGGYETRLGVRPAELETAIRACFASSLDVRVFSYRREHGLDPWSPRIAVIVQRQIDSDVAGVGFSLNPITNDYDEAVIDASWGLGPAVVEGRVTPDHFVVNRVDRRVVEETRGDKRVSMRLDADGGTAAREERRSAERTLSNGQLLELIDAMGRIEALYDTPVDIEWAYSGGTLHLLQARPITTYVPLPAEMTTRPGERRRLYADAALSKGLTMNEPISPLGLDAVERMFSAILESWVDPLRRDVAPADALHIFAGDRMYVNLSNVMWFASPASIARSSAPSDTLMAEILAGVDPQRYRAAARPAWAGSRLVRLVPRLLWSMRGLFWSALRAILLPESSYRRYRARIEAFETELRESSDAGVPLEEFRRTYELRIAREFDVLMSALLVGLISPDLLIRGKAADVRALAETGRRGVTGNVVVEMGMALHRLANLLDRSEFEDLSRLAERIERRLLPPEFLDAWDDFMLRFGCRGPLEMDLASPRYADDPRLALGQMSSLAVDGGFDPAAAHRHHVEERRRANTELLRRAGRLRRALLRRIYQLNDLFAGTRDMPKYLIVQLNHAIRKRALIEGRRLTHAGRLDAAEHVFDLRFDDLRAAADDATLDLRRIRDERTRFRRKLDAHVRSFPPVIDSRGRILRPPPTEQAPGVLRGMPVSAGVASGPVRILHTPHGQRVEKGDILVAYTTDPGWTPLFVNAAAIVLEVGGALQHGAVVAREYGKPCVVGIDRVVTKLCDGERVEVDGTTGTVRRLS